MKLRRFSLNDYEELVDMYYEFAKEVYMERKIGMRYSFYKSVDSWINEDRDIIVAYNGSELCGFTESYIDNNNGITEPVYMGEIAYTKPKYRKGRASYMLYNNVVEYAKQLGMTLVSFSRVENGVDKMVNKHFSPVKTYQQFELRR